MATQTESRLMPIDATRGLAMICVAMSHLGSTFAWYRYPVLGSALEWIGFFATPNFLLFSGLVAGYQLALAKSDATLLRIVDRGIFIFLGGHLLVCAALLYLSNPGDTFRSIVITDLIGLYLCATPLLRRLSGRWLGIVGVVLFVVSLPIAMVWHPAGDAASILAALLFGIESTGRYAGLLSSHLLPYLGMFMVGMAVGRDLPSLLRTRGRARVGASFARLGAVLIAAAACMNVVGHFAKPLVFGSDGGSLAGQILIAETNFRGKTPPSLAYWLAYGGAGILMVGVLMRARESARWLAGAGAMAVIGRASFVSYISQQWLITFLPFWLGFNGLLLTRFVIVYLGLSVLAMYGIARLWDLAGANRFLTVGLKPERSPTGVAYGSPV